MSKSVENHWWVAAEQGCVNTRERWLCPFSFVLSPLLSSQFLMDLLVSPKLVKENLLKFSILFRMLVFSQCFLNILILILVFSEACHQTFCYLGVPYQVRLMHKITISQQLKTREGSCENTAEMPFITQNQSGVRKLLNTVQ